MVCPETCTDLGAGGRNQLPRLAWGTFPQELGAVGVGSFCLSCVPILCCGNSLLFSLGDRLQQKPVIGRLFASGLTVSMHVSDFLL